MAEKPAGGVPPLRLSSAQSRTSSKDSGSPQHTNPGEIAESPERPPAQQYYTLVDNSTPGGQNVHHNNPAEPVGAQDEIAFPLTTDRTSTPRDDFEDLDPKDYGIDFDGEEEKVYEPPSRDAQLPDLQHLLASLEEPATPEHPVLIDEAPSLFSRPENVENYKKISELKLQMEEDKVGDYVVEFEEGVRDDVLMIGSIGLEDVQEEEKHLRDEHIRYLETEAMMEEERRRRIRLHEEAAKKRAAYVLWQKRQEIQRMEQLLQQKERLMMDRLQKSFRRSENQLVTELQRRKGEVKTYYGDLMTADGHYGGNHGRRWKVDWDRTPQPIQIKLNCLRGVKDKLPGGRYVLMVSLYNRLGGHIMRWSNVKGQQWGGATLPITHDGHYFNIEMKMDQSVFTVLPSRPGVRPGMVLMFELFLLRGAVVSTDRVVAWGSFPIADGTFDIIEGKYQCPLLRGEMDLRIETHEKLESLIASDLDHWMSNLYFEIVKLPRYLSGQKEYEVELQFSSGILAYPDRVNTGEEVHDGEEAVYGSLPDIKEPREAVTGPPGHRESSEFSGETSGLNISDEINPSSDSRTSSLKKLPLEDSLEDVKKVPLADDLKSGVRQRRPYSTIGSRVVKRDNQVKVAEESDTDYDDDEIHLMKKDTDFYPVKGQPGMFYKKHQYNPVDDYHRKLFSLLPRTPFMTQQRRKRKKLTHLERLEEHKFSVRYRSIQFS